MRSRFTQYLFGSLVAFSVVGCMKQVEAQRAKVVEVEAQMTLTAIVTQLRTNYVENNRLCPSTTPVPTELSLVKSGLYTSTSKDWDESWTCLYGTKAGDNALALPAQHFQYAITVADDNQSVAVTAKGYPGGPASPLRTFSRTCKVSEGSLACGELVTQ